MTITGRRRTLLGSSVRGRFRLRINRHQHASVRGRHDRRKRGLSRTRRSQDENSRGLAGLFFARASAETAFARVGLPSPTGGHFVSRVVGHLPCVAHAFVVGANTAGEVSHVYFMHKCDLSGGYWSCRKACARGVRTHTQRICTLTRKGTTLVYFRGLRLLRRWLFVVSFEAFVCKVVGEVLLCPG